MTDSIKWPLKVTFIKWKNKKHLFSFFLINSTQLERNKKIHQHTTKVTVAYHKIYSIQREALRILYKKTNKQKKKKSLMSSFRSNGTPEEKKLKLSSSKMKNPSLNTYITWAIHHISHKRKQVQNSQCWKDLLSISQRSHARFANSQYGKVKGKTFQLKMNLVG